MTNSINEALGFYKDVLETFPKFYPKGNISFQSLEVVSPLSLLKGEESAILTLHSDLYLTVKAFETLANHMSLVERQQQYSFMRDERYINTKFEIFYEWFKRTFNVDLVEYKDETERLWSAKILLDMYHKANVSGNPIPNETWELLKDVDEEQDKIIRYIRKFIGYMGEIKI